MPSRAAGGGSGQLGALVPDVVLSVASDRG
jgi:hypothetical protein